MNSGAAMSKEMPERRHHGIVVAAQKTAKIVAAVAQSNCHFPAFRFMPHKHADMAMQLMDVILNRGDAHSRKTIAPIIPEQAAIAFPKENGRCEWFPSRLVASKETMMSPRQKYPAIVGILSAIAFFPEPRIASALPKRQNARQHTGYNALEPDWGLSRLQKHG